MSKKKLRNRRIVETLDLERLEQPSTLLNLRVPLTTWLGP